MNRNLRLKHLATLGWRYDETAGNHLICNERCDWIFGKVGAVEWSAWISQRSGMVYLHGTPSALGEYDFTFDVFVSVIANGWPTPKVAPAARSLFDDDDDVTK